MNSSGQSWTHTFEYCIVCSDPEAADTDHREIEIFAPTHGSMADASFSSNQFRGLLAQIDENTPIQHLTDFTVTGDTASVDGSQLSYNSEYGVYEITRPEAAYSIPFTPEDLETLLRMVGGVETESSYDSTSYMESLPLAVYLRDGRKNHIIRGGTTACGYNVAISHPTINPVVPITDLPDDRLAHAVYTEGLCTQCSNTATSEGLTDNLSREDAATPTCPVTGQQATGITISRIAGTYLDLPDGRQEITRESLNEWRYGQRDDVEPAN